MKGLQRVLLGLLLTSSLPADGLAQTTPGDLSMATIEDLLNMEITSAGRKAQRLGDVAASRRVSLSVVGQNLWDPSHAEYAGNGAIVTPTRIPRSARIELTWGY